jgi:hypothetical protein
MKKITFKKLQQKNFDTYQISNIPLIGKCKKCKIKYQYSNVKKFLRNRRNKTEIKHLWNTCQKCWLIINTSESPDWIKKNSNAQKIAQNKPETLQKNRDGVRKSWTKKRRKSASDILKNKWKNDAIFRNKALLNLNSDIDRVKIGFGNGGLKGEYKGIKYDSGLELSFILWCEQNNIPIKRYDLSPVSYKDENEIERNYYPDFVINNGEIIEIKGHGLWYSKNYERNILKRDAAKRVFPNFQIIFDYHKTVKTYYKTARKIHNETYKKN